MYDIITRYEFAVSGEAAHFEEVLQDIQFVYNCRHLSEAGLMKPEEIRQAISRAMLICQLNGIDSRNHFKPVYVSSGDEHSLYTDWCMTRQGFSLVVMNAPTPNYAIAKWQWELVNSVTN